MIRSNWQWAKAPNSTPVTAVVALAGRAAVEHILSSAVIIDGAVGTVETTVSTFLDYAGVGAALTSAANSVAQAITNGTEAEVQAALDAATLALQTNPNIQLALGQALKGAVKSVIGDTGIVNEISTTVQTFIADVSSDPTIHAALVDQLRCAIRRRDRGRAEQSGRDGQVDRLDHDGRAEVLGGEGSCGRAERSRQPGRARGVQQRRSERRAAGHLD